MTTANAWLVRRAILALALMVGFYVLALGLAAGLLWIPYAGFSTDTRIPAKLVFFCVAGAGAIVWAILPRPDRFEPPGPAVRADAEPALFAALEEVAAATSQEMPAEVYLVNEVNAFVTQRGGVMGFGSRRVMGLGLPLMQAVTVSEFKAILAHEFGHYHAGDVKLGPWIYKTRAAIGRAIEQLSDNILQAIFVWYGNLFLRITHAVSRRQEFVADEIAARVAGAGVMASALRRTHGAAVAFHGYSNSELGPVLRSGYLPPVLAGFVRFMECPRVAARVSSSIQAEEAHGETDEFDTHPPLRERVAALAALPDGPAGDANPATTLLRNPAAWERRLLGAQGGDEWVRSLRTIEWDTVMEAVYLPSWRAAVKEHARLLGDVTPATLPFMRVGPVTDSERARGAGMTDEATALRVHTMATALVLALIDLGWTATTTPGEDIVLRRDGHELRPFNELPAVAEGVVSAEAWRASCAALGIADVPLAGAVVGA